MLDPLDSALASSIAARNEQWPELSAHTPFPGWLSCESVVVFTVKVWTAADATDGVITTPYVPATRRAPGKVAALILRFSNMIAPHAVVPSLNLHNVPFR